MTVRAATYDAAGRKEAERLSLARAMSVLRAASAGGTQTASKASVVAAAAAVQTGGRTVMSMDYYHARGGSAVPFPQPFFGRPSLTCTAPQCGGGYATPGAAGLQAIKEAAEAEGIAATPFALKAAHAVATHYSKNLAALLKHDSPRTKVWTAAHVRKAAV